MKKLKLKHTIFAVTVLLLTLFHLVITLNYNRLYGYFNAENQLEFFILLVKLFRYGLYAVITVFGYISLRDALKKILPAYLLFFLFNLILPFLF